MVLKVFAGLRVRVFGRRRRCRISFRQQATSTTIGVTPKTTMLRSTTFFAAAVAALTFASSSSAFAPSQGTCDLFPQREDVAISDEV